MTQTIKAERQWLRARIDTQPIGVDRENRVILGYVVAQEGPFKTPGRGEFDGKALRSIVRLMAKNRDGLKSRLAHPTLSDDGVGTLLGRVKNGRIDTATVERNGEELTVEAVRGDLYLNPASSVSPKGDLAEYVMTLAESDPNAVSTSLVLQTDEEWRLDNHGKPRKDENGVDLPPLWRPTALHASDVVDTGDAVDGMLSIQFDKLSDANVRQAAEFIDRAFPNLSREEVSRRLGSWMQKYLDHRFGVEPLKTPNVHREWIAEFLKRAKEYVA